MNSCCADVGATVHIPHPRTRFLSDAPHIPEPGSCPHIPEPGSCPTSPNQVLVRRPGSGHPRAGNFVGRATLEPIRTLPLAVFSCDFRPRSDKFCPSSSPSIHSADSRAPHRLSPSSGCPRSRLPSRPYPVEFHRTPRPLRKHHRAAATSELHGALPVLDPKRLQLLQLLHSLPTVSAPHTRRESEARLPAPGTIERRLSEDPFPAEEGNSKFFHALSCRGFLHLAPLN